MRNEILIFGVVAAAFAGCAAEPESPASVEDPATAMVEPESSSSTLDLPPPMIVAERGGFMPEGVEYDSTNGRVLTGSLSEGSVLHIDHDGRVMAVVTDPDLISSVGIEVDEPRGRLLVANSDRSVFQSGGAGQAKLGVYDLTTGERIAMVDLAAAIVDAPADAGYFANDVAVADDGTAYVTDTRMSAIYRVGTDYQASVLHRFDDFSPNGIVHHSGDYLIVCGGGTLWKVPLDDPTDATPVALSEELAGLDGMVWAADGRLAIVSNSGNRVVALTSGDDWATAELAGIATFETQATTAAVVGDHIYVVHPHLGDEDPPSVERVLFQ